MVWSRKKVILVGGGACLCLVFAVLLILNLLTVVNNWGALGELNDPDFWGYSVNHQDRIIAGVTALATAATAAIYQGVLTVVGGVVIYLGLKS